VAEDARFELARACTNTLSKSVGLGSPRFKRVRDLGSLSYVVCAELLRT
jgi:hypothetical protein